MTIAIRQPDRPGFRPLYQQVRELLLARIASGIWRPAEAIPSEQALAGELGVSQGTVRKALDSLAADSLVERRQGKGTFVSEHTQESAHFRFFKVAYANGERIKPTCPRSSISRRAVRHAERLRLGIAVKSDVFHIRRDRHIDGQPAVRESIVAPADLFPDLDQKTPLPNTLYTLYQSTYGVSIVSASEQVQAVAANREDALALDLEPGTPMLQVDRTAYDITGRAVELRQSRFATGRHVYLVDLR